MIFVKQSVLELYQNIRESSQACEAGSTPVSRSPILSSPLFIIHSLIFIIILFFIIHPLYFIMLFFFPA